MSAFTCILPHNNSTGAPQLCLRGTHKWMFDKPNWLTCIFKSPRRKCSKAANHLHKNHPSRSSHGATLWLSHWRFASTRLSCWLSSTEERSSCEQSSLSGRGKDAGGCSSATQPASYFIFSHSWPVGWWVTTGLIKKEHTYSVGCLLLLACVIPAQLRLSDLTTLSVSHTT